MPSVFLFWLNCTADKYITDADMTEILAAAVLNKNQNAFAQMMNIQYLTKISHKKSLSFSSDTPFRP